MTSGSGSANEWPEEADSSKGKEAGSLFFLHSEDWRHQRRGEFDNADAGRGRGEQYRVDAILDRPALCFDYRDAAAKRRHFLRTDERKKQLNELLNRGDGSRDVGVARTY
ncbi:hypothetical protein MAGR_67640 [Mycolicibacterium agri]|uniref:Uncharacterized protein n=1 Tax=Mycolicibacterium agri TaxID=36811 RepID=A0A7I9WC55_MYCAG|nr:hypothetical protein MAGR_67640 [Mycolicibacterium agri]